MNLARMELARQDWDSITCGCKQPARHLVELLESAIDGRPGALRALDGHVFVQSILMPPAPAVCSVVMAMLADGVRPSQREEVMWAILWFAAGEEDGDSVDSGYYWRCFETIRDGLWLLYREFLNPEDMPHAHLDDIFDIVEWDAPRLAHYRARG